MKFIDEKGRLFGKLNLIDLLVILLIVAVLATVIWKTAGEKAAEAVQSPPLRVTYTVLCEDVPKDIAEFAKTQVGEAILNNAKFLDATITACDSTLMDGASKDGHRALYLTIEAAATTSNNIYKVSSQEVRVGYAYNVKTPYFELEGVICDLEVQNG